MSNWKSKSDDSSTLEATGRVKVTTVLHLRPGRVKLTTVLHLGHVGTAAKSPKRAPLEVELKSNELIPSDPILNLITLCVGAAKVKVKVTTVLHLETLEE